MSMKVLWFTNSPVSAAQKNIRSDFIGEGWIGALESILINQKDIELAVCCKSILNDIKMHMINKTKYYIVPFNTYKHGYFISKKNNNSVRKRNTNYYLEIISDFRPDIIHIFGSENDYGLIIPLINIPVVIHIQGNLTVYNLKYFNRITKWDLIKFSGLKEILRSNTALHRYYYLENSAARERQIFKYCNYYMGRTCWDRRIVSILAPGSNYYHCEEAIRSEFFNSSWEKTDNQHAKLVSVIRGNFYKGLDTVLETSRLLKSLNFSFDWQIIGCNSSDRTPKIYERKYKTKYSNVNVRLMGKKNTHEIIDLLLSSDIFIHPSHIENSPNSICEAMVLGMPIIATAVGGTSSILKNEQEGILVQDGDPYAMAGAILELFNDQNLQNLFSQNARQRALKRHNINDIVRGLITIYKNIIEDFQKKKNKT